MRENKRPGCEGQREEERTERQGEGGQGERKG